MNKLSLELSATQIWKAEQLFSVGARAYLNMYIGDGRCHKGMQIQHQSGQMAEVGKHLKPPEVEA